MDSTLEPLITGLLVHLYTQAYLISIALIVEEGLLTSSNGLNIFIRSLLLFIKVNSSIYSLRQLALFIFIEIDF